MRRATQAARRFLAFLGSLRLATVLLILLAAACVIGGLLPQAPVTPNAELTYRSYGTFWVRVITRLRLDDIFGSPWFFALTGLFALNLLLCTAGHARATLRRLLGPPRYVPLSGDEAGKLCLRPTAHGDRRIALLIEAVGASGLRRVDRVVDGGGRVQLVAQRRRFGAVGVDLVHAGILVILAGALLGMFRAEGTLRVREGDVGTRFRSCGDVAVDEERGDPCLALPFDIRVDDFGVETYPETMRVKDYWAELSIWKNEAVVREGRTSVNRPLTVGGTGFYTWRYGEDPSAAFVRLQVFDRDRDAVTTEVELRIGETVSIPGTQLWIEGLRFYRTFSVDDRGEAVDLGNVPGGHSGVLLRVGGVDGESAEIAYRDIAFPFLPETNGEADVCFLLADVRIPAFIDLHYARNPGYPVFWWGFVLVMIGLAIALYVRPSTVRIALEGDRILLRAEDRGGTSRIDRLARRLDVEDGLDSESDPEDDG